MIQEPEVATEPKAIRWGFGGWAVAIAALAIGFANFPLRVVGWRMDYLPGDAIDDRLNNFVLEHGYRYLTQRTDGFWNAPAFYPTPAITVCSDAHIGLLPLYAGFRAAGLSPEAAFQAWFLIPFALNYASAVWALRRLGFGPAGTAAGAFVFAFGLPLSAQLIHAQLFPRFLVPPAIVLAWEFLHSPRTYKLAACLGCIAYQLYVSVYIGFLLVLVLGCGFVLSVVRCGWQLPWNELVHPKFHVWLDRAVVLLAALAAMLPLVISHRQAVGVAGLEVVRSTAPHWEAWITPCSFAAVFPMLEESDSHPKVEDQLFPGFLPVFAVLIGALAGLRKKTFRGKAQLASVAAWSVVLLALFVTHFEFVWLYRPMVDLPGGNSIRAVGRIVLVLLFPMAVALAACVDEIVRFSKRFGLLSAPACLIALALVVADQWLAPTDGERGAAWSEGRLSREWIVSRQNKIKKAIARHPAPTLLYVFPSEGVGPKGYLGVQLEAMRAAQDLGVSCVNGYSGYLPARWDYFSSYRDLTVWLNATNTPAEKLSGLVLIPEPDNR